jgi:hypothetical protein
MIEAAPPAITPAPVFHGAPFLAEIGPAISGTKIYYTLDGTQPYPENPAAIEYLVPVPIDQTTALRAARVGDNFKPSGSVTKTYIFPAQVADQGKPAGYPSETDNSTFGGGGQSYSIDYEVDPDVVGPGKPDARTEFAAQLRELPTVSVTADPEDLFWIKEGIYANSGSEGKSWERAASFEWIDPANGETVAQANAALELSGHSSRYANVSPKHNMRVKFKGDYGPSRLAASGLFEGGTDAGDFNSLYLRNPTHDSWAVGYYWGANRESAKYTNDAWASGMMRMLGHPSNHRRLIHLYLNGLYWGVYEAVERIDKDFARSYLSPDDPAADFDVLKASSGSSDGVIDGGNGEWDTLRNDAWRVWYTARNGQDPEPKYEVAGAKIAAENLIDYILVNAYMGNLDWPMHNFRVLRRHAEGEPFRFLSWDAEFSMREDRGVSDNIVSRLTLANEGPGYLYYNLRYAAAFRAAVRARLDALTLEGGPLSPGGVAENYGGELAKFEGVALSESARWGDTHREIPYGPEDLAGRRAWLVDQFIPARTAFLRQHVLEDLETAEAEVEYWIATSSGGGGGGGNPGGGGGTPTGNGDTNHNNEIVDEAQSADADGDGMGDAWEIAHGFDPADPTDRNGDADGDGVENWLEHLVGTDPNDPTSNLDSIESPDIDVFTRLIAAGAE